MKIASLKIKVYELLYAHGKRMTGYGHKVEKI